MGQMADRVLPLPSPDKIVGAFFTAVAKGDAKGVAGLIAAQNADEQLLRPGLGGLCAAVGEFDRVVTETFGAAKTGRWGAAVGESATRTVKPEPGHPDRSSVVLNLATDATPAGGAAELQVPLVLEAGQWRLTFGAVAALMRLRQVDASIPADEPLRRLTEMTEALRSVTAEVKARHIPSAEAAADAGRAALVDAARGKNAQ